ncbi:MAG: hypothetical protein AAB439_01730 [Patescibacteria group bacterium]
MIDKNFIVSGAVGTLAYWSFPKRFDENGEEDLLFTLGDWEFGTDDASFTAFFILAYAFGMWMDSKRSTAS